MASFASTYGIWNIADLKAEYPAASTLAMVMGPDWPVTEALAHYAWDSASTATPDDDEVLLPNFMTVLMPGRWIKIDIEAPAQVNADWNAVSGPAFIVNKPALHAVSVSGNYNDLINKPTIPSAPAQSSATRSLNTAFQVSATRAAIVSYSVQITVTATIAGGQNGDVILEIASNSGFTNNVQTVAIAGSGQTYSLAVALQGVQPQTSVVFGVVPVGYYVRLRTVNNTGTPSYSFRSGQETLI